MKKFNSTWLSENFPYIVKRKSNPSLFMVMSWWCHGDVNQCNMCWNPTRFDPSWYFLTGFGSNLSLGIFRSGQRFKKSPGAAGKWFGSRGTRCACSPVPWGAHSSSQSSTGIWPLCAVDDTLDGDGLDEADDDPRCVEDKEHDHRVDQDDGQVAILPLLVGAISDRLRWGCTNVKNMCSNNEVVPGLNSFSLYRADYFWKA
jgi:hypothetical protein